MKFSGSSSMPSSRICIPFSSAARREAMAAVSRAPDSLSSRTLPAVSKACSAMMAWLCR